MLSTSMTASYSSFSVSLADSQADQSMAGPEPEQDSKQAGSG